ncbi:hypothetical protein AX15_000581 [Amanita polypyramis BW_CC]|nr:hypothetical protein AX15_000581 [Amanita polypyramis BW_CC]
MSSQPSPDQTQQTQQANPGQPTSNVTDAEKPFDSSAKADMILRSSDSVDFFVLKSFLSFVSSVFDDMFSLNRGVAAQGTDARNGLFIVPLTEDSVTLYNLLLLIYPYAKQPIDEVAVIVKMARAARKYLMDEIDGKLRRSLTESKKMAEQPLRAFAVAVHFGWEKEAKAAACGLLATPAKDMAHCAELDLITGTDYQRLLKWRLKCYDAVYNLLSRWYSSGSSESGQRTEMHERFVSVEYLAGLLLDRLRTTGCPRSIVILDNSTQVKALKNIKVCGKEGIGFSHHRTQYLWHDLDTRIQDWALEELFKIIKTIMQQIDEIALKVPFKIGDA